MTEEEKKYQKELWKQDRIRQRKEEWEKIKSLGFGARLQYFWDYYKIVLAIAAAVILVVYLAVTMIQGARTRTLLYVCFLNADELDPDTEHLQEDFIQARGGIGKMQNIVFDSSIYVDPEAVGTSQRDVAASIKITSYVGAGALDVFLAPSNVTKFEQEGAMLLALDELLTEDEIGMLREKGCLYYDTEPDTDRLSRGGSGMSEQTEEDPGSGFKSEESAFSLNTRQEEGQKIYAVRIDQAGVLGNYSIYDDEPVWFSVIGNSPRTEEAMRFLRFLLAEEDLKDPASEE